MVSHAHISERAEDLGLFLVLLNEFAERAVTAFHVRKLVLILDEEAAAVLAHGDGNVRHHVLEVALGEVRAEVGHVLDEDLLEAHRAHHVLAHAHWLVVLLGDLVLGVLEQALSKEVVLDTLVMVIHREDLLLLTYPLVPATSTAAASTGSRWVHAKELSNPNGRDARIRHELDERQRVEAAEVANSGVAAVGTAVTPAVGERVHVDAAVAGHSEALLVLEGL